MEDNGQTVTAVIKVNPQLDGTSQKHIVNLFTYQAEHFEQQAIKLKQLYYKYKARRIVIDGNGIGLSLMDFMVIKQTLDDGSYYPPFGVYGGTYEKAGQEYRNFRTNDTEDDAIYVVKANVPINTAIYSTVQSQIESGKIKFLIEQRAAKTKLLGKRIGQEMTPEQRNEYLMPFTLTDILREEMLNLREENEGVNIILKPANRVIGHDKFSALAYGIYYIREIEDSKNRRRCSKFSQMMFMS